MDKMKITLSVNGTGLEVEVNPNTTLLSLLRDQLYLTGAKEGCGNGECGACVVILDGKPVNSCLVLVGELQGAQVITIEGLEKDGMLHPLQQAFLDHEAYQCGYCTPGMILTAYGLLLENSNPTSEEVRLAIAGNLCRCTGYQRIVDAVMDAAEVLHG